MAIRPLVAYWIARQTPLPPVQGSLYDYVLAGNGLFVRGERDGLRAMIPVMSCRVRGLAEVEPFVELIYPRIPADLLRLMLELARAASPDGQPIEAVFHLSWSGLSWELEIPVQEASAAHVQPLGPAIGSSYARALIEVHSHHTMPARFSEVDDADETGFRLFGVLGDIFGDACLRVRVGVYGHRWEIPAASIFELPEEVADCLAREPDKRGRES